MKVESQREQCERLEERCRGLESLVGTVRSYLPIPARNVGDISIMEHAYEIAGAIAFIKRGNPQIVQQQEALDLIDEFEIVGDNNGSRDPTDEEKFVLREFVLELFDERRFGDGAGKRYKPQVDDGGPSLVAQPPVVQSEGKFPSDVLVELAKEWLMQKALAEKAPDAPLFPFNLPDEGKFHNPIQQVYFRAGLIACREFMARFVTHDSPLIAASIRHNWWPSLGEDLGAPRKIKWEELMDGEYGQPGARVKDSSEISPTLEALPIAMAFLNEVYQGDYK